MIGDILSKLARGDALTRDEQNKLRFFGDAAEQGNYFISSIQNGQGSLDVGSIVTDKLSAGVFFDTTFRLNLADDTGGYAIANDTAVTPNITTWITVSNYGFVVNGGVFTFPATGYYFIRISANWDSGSTGYRQVSFQGTNDEITDMRSASGGVSVNTMSGEIYAERGEEYSLVVRHTNGASLNFNYPNIFIRLDSI